MTTVIAFNAPLRPTDTADPSAVGVVYKSALDGGAKCLKCSPCQVASVCCLMGPLGIVAAVPCEFCCWDKLSPRGYVAVHENRIETNYPFLCCFGLMPCCIRDSVWTGYYDKLGPDATEAKCCTPYHCCCCVQCCGPVIAFAPYPWCNYFFCCLCRTFVPAVQDPNTFLNAYRATRNGFETGQRITKSVQGQVIMMANMNQVAPQPQQMQ